jgi:hypothetical protein
MGLCASLDLAQLEVVVETRSDDAGRRAMASVPDDTLDRPRVVARVAESASWLT